MMVIDCETTGLEPAQYAIVSVGALDFENPENQFYGECKIWDGALIDLKSLACNGFNEQQVRDPSKMSQSELLRQLKLFISKIDNQTPAGHNARLDVEFLYVSGNREHVLFPLPYRMIDLHSIAAADMMRQGKVITVENNVSAISLDRVLTYVGLPSEPLPHHALTGAKMEAEAFSRIIYGRNLLPEFQKHAVPEYLLQYSKTT